MNNILSQPFVKDFIIPLLAVFITIVVKVVSRKDAHLSITRDDFAVGFDLIISSLILLVTYASKVAIELQSNEVLKKMELYKRKLEVLPWILLFSILGLWGLSTIVRIYGWETTTTNQLNKTWGVGMPFVVGLICLLLTVNFVE